MDDMQVYIANLGKYNEGELVDVSNSMLAEDFQQIGRAHV